MADTEVQTTELLNWYDRNRRILPWREDPTPYHVWLSEIMLQQTRVEAGKAYYLRFLETLPYIAALAAAPEDVYLKLWEGLGYYSRVRNLHKAAVMIMEQYGGEMPGTARELERLPGIGPYSAAAIASIAFHEPVVSVDGNLLRVFARMTEYNGDIKSTAAKKAAAGYYEERITAAGERPGDFNQALMDLGAGICLPSGEPLCDQCPWQARCLSCSHGRQQEFPVMSEKKKRKIERRVVFLLTAEGRIAIRKRPHKGLLADLYEFPNVEITEHADANGLSDAETQEKADIRREILAKVWQILKESGRSEDWEKVVEIRGLSEARHIFSHIEWHMTGYEIRLPRIKEAEGILWVTKEELEQKYSIPSAFEVYRKEAKRILAEG